jgi:ABC-2 type transport system permease protein
MARGLIVGFVVMLVSLFFTSLDFYSPVLIVTTALLTSLVFSLGGFINAMFATKFDDISIVPTFVLTPLTYLGGVFYSINLLSPFWQGLSMANPIQYMVNAFRYGVLGASDVAPFYAIGMLVIFAVVLFSLSLWLLDRGKGIRQ